MGNKVPEAAASGKFPTSGLLPGKIAGATTSVAGVMQKNPGYAGSPEMQTSVTTWVSAANAIGATVAQIAALRLTLTALLLTLAKQIPIWKRATDAVVALVNTLSAGSPQAIGLWGLELVTHTAATLSIDPPAKLRAVFRTNAMPIFRWAGVDNHVGYFVQIGDGTPAGWGAQIACPKATYEPPGLTLGQKIAVRVAVQRRSGMSNWSDALLVTVH